MLAVGATALGEVTRNVSGEDTHTRVLGDTVLDGGRLIT